MANITQSALKTAFVTCLAMSPLLADVVQLRSRQTAGMVQPQVFESIGIDRLQQIEPHLMGRNVTFAVVCPSFTYSGDCPQNNYQPFVERNGFNINQFRFYGHALLPAGISPHATAICSILAGYDVDAFHPVIGLFYYQGVAPQAKIDVYEQLFFLTENIFNHIPPDADIILAGWGYPFEDWWTRGIESLVEDYGIPVVASVGNGTHAFDCIYYPGASANIVCVGVVCHVHTGDLETDLSYSALPNPEYSSCGPTDDGRCKPDIVAPGYYITADAYDSNGYESVSNGSSFAVPAVAGVIGLLIQKANEIPLLHAAVSSDGGNCVMKAIILNSATKLPYWHKGHLGIDDDHTVPLDFLQGAGMINAVRAYHQLIAGLHKPGKVPVSGWDLNRLDKTDSPEHNYRFNLPESDNKWITVTLAWNRHYSDKFPFDLNSSQDSNLRLEAWAIDSNDPDLRYLIDYSDSVVDNIEHIHFTAEPNCTTYEIVVSFSDAENQQESPSQVYGIAWNVSSEEAMDDLLWYDLNADGIVDNADSDILINNIRLHREHPDSYVLGDITQDGLIDMNDWDVLMDNFGRQATWRTKLELEGHITPKDNQ